MSGCSFRRDFFLEPGTARSLEETPSGGNPLYACTSAIASSGLFITYIPSFATCESFVQHCNTDAWRKALYAYTSSVASSEIIAWRQALYAYSFTISILGIFIRDIPSFATCESFARHCNMLCEKPSTCESIPSGMICEQHATFQTCA